MIKFHCSNCNQKLGVPDEYAGRRIRCNKCNQPAVVPQPAAQAQPQTPAAAAPKPAAPAAAPKPATPVAKPAAPAPKPQPAPVIPAPVEPEILDLEMVSDNGLPTEDPNLQAIQEASRQRASKISFSRPAGKKASAAPSKAGQVAKGLGKIPMALGLSIACMAAVITLWVIIGKVIGIEIGYIVVLVPIAGAFGLTCLVEHRSIFLGLLAVILGFGGMLVGRALIAKMVIMPMWEQDEEFQADKDEIQKGIEDSIVTLPEDPELLKEMARNDDLMLKIAAWDMIESGKLDKESFTKMFSSEEDLTEEVQEQIDSAMDRAEIHLDDWNTKQRTEALTRHYTPMQQHCKETIQPLLETGAETVTFIIAFIASFGLFDLVLFPIGLFSAFKIAAALDGED